MNSVLTNDILIGRPCGGVATLIHNSYKKIVLSHVSADRLPIVYIDTLVLVNVYLPCSPRGDTLDLLSDLLNEILSILSDIEYDKLLFGGDINCDPSITSNGSTLVNSFVSSLGANHLVLPTTIMDNLSIAAFTHVQEKLNRHSGIDHFFVAGFDPSGLVGYMTFVPQIAVIIFPIIYLDP